MARYNAAMARAKRIAVLLPNWVGDVVMSTPALRALRARFAASKLTFVGRSTALDVLSGLPWPDAVLVDRSRCRPRLRHFLAQARALRTERFHLAVLLPNSFRAAALARLAGVPRIAGYDRDARGWMLSDKLPPPRDARGGLLPGSMIDYYLELAAAVGARAAGRHMELALTPAEAQAADALLADADADPARPLVMLNPGAAFGRSKMWDPERFAELGDRLAERRGAQLIVNAAPAERGIAAEVGEAMRRRALISFADRDNTLGMLKGLLRRCALLVTNDTGARHVAAALGAGVVTLFGSTDPRWSRTDYPRERTVRADVPCSPCQRKLCPQPAGPRYHQCMWKITVEEVLAACEQVLDMAPQIGRGPRP